MSKKSSIDMNEVRRLIESEKLSTYGVAEQLGCNQSHVVRLIQKYNKEHPGQQINKRDKSEAQRNYISKGNHQRNGTTHSDKSRNMISDTMRELYDSPAGEDIREKISNYRQEEWANMTDDERQDVLQNLKQANRSKAQSGTGSNFENFLAENLKSNGYKVEQRTQQYTPGQKFHVDIALFDQKIIVEVDGPTHFEPIYGDAELLKVVAKDNNKDIILHSNGWNVLRVQDSSGSMTRARFSRVLQQIEYISKQYTGKPTTHYVKP